MLRSSVVVGLSEGWRWKERVAPHMVSPQSSGSELEQMDESEDVHCGITKL